MMKKLLLSIVGVSLCFSELQAACLKPEVKQADQRWAQAIKTGQPETVTQLYAKGAVLLATYENQPIVTDTGKQQYFSHLFQTVKNLQVHYNQEIIHTFPGGAVSSGIYTFSGMQDGKQVEIPARFTFVYEDSHHGCKLVAHHSSVLPKSQ